MKIKGLISILLIVLVFSLVGCATPKQVVVETVAITTVAAVTTIPETTAAITTVAETTAPVTTIEEVTEATISTEDAKDNVKKAYVDLIEGTYGGKVTKFIISANLLNIIVSYNTQWGGDDAVKKEMFDITTAFTVGENPPSFDLELSAATQLGDTYHSVTTKENLEKIQNLEMDYTDWLGVAFK